MQLFALRQTGYGFSFIIISVYLLLTVFFFPGGEPNPRSIAPHSKFIRLPDHKNARMRNAALIILGKVSLTYFNFFDEILNFCHQFIYPFCIEFVIISRTDVWDFVVLN